MLRSCYTARWYPFKGDRSRSYLVRWYEVPRTRPVVEGLTIWRSSNWDECLDVITPGEDHRTARWCEPGPALREPLGVPRQCGDAEVWAGTWPDPPTPLVLDALGNPACCGPAVGFADGPEGWDAGADVEQGRLVSAASGWQAPADVGRDTSAASGWDCDYDLAPAAVDVPQTAWDSGWRALLLPDTGPEGWDCDYDAVIEPTTQSFDYWYWMPAVFRGSCAPGDPPAPSYQVAGLTQGAVVANVQWPKNVIAFVPLPWVRRKKITGVFVVNDESADPLLQYRLRGAIYNSRARGCLFPDVPQWNLGTTDIGGAGIHSFPGGGSIIPRPNALLWVALWLERGQDLRQLRSGSIFQGQPWPLGQFPGVGVEVPSVGWSIARGWQTEAEVRWDEISLVGASELRVDGYTAATGDLVGVPAVFVAVEEE